MRLSLGEPVCGLFSSVSADILADSEKSVWDALDRAVAGLTSFDGLRRIYGNHGEPRKGWRLVFATGPLAVPVMEAAGLAGKQVDRAQAGRLSERGYRVDTAPDGGLRLCYPFPERG